MSQPALPPQLSLMHEVGAQMVRARVQAGLSQQQASDRLHIRLRYIQAMEAGRLEDLPGKAYARGYLHSYAQLLGLDADAVVARCFSTDLPIPTLGHAPELSAVRHAPKLSLAAILQARHYGLLLLVALVGAVVLGQVWRPVSALFAAEETPVTPVPEALLETARTMVMPTMRNKDCLIEERLLACFYASAESQLLAAFEQEASTPFFSDEEVQEMLDSQPVEEDMLLDDAGRV